MAARFFPFLKSLIFNFDIILGLNELQQVVKMSSLYCPK